MLNMIEGKYAPIISAIMGKST